MWGAYDARNTVFGGNPCHLKTLFPTFSAIIEARQYMTMKINHSQLLSTRIEPELSGTPFY